MDSAINTLRQTHAFLPPILVPRNLGTGFHTALLRTDELLGGPPFGFNPRDGVWTPDYRCLRISLVLAYGGNHDPQEDIRATIFTLGSDLFQWPDAGVEVPVILKTRGVLINGSPACEIKRIRRGGLLGS